MTTIRQLLAGAPLPGQPRFPVELGELGDEQRVWRVDATRYPAPMTPLEFEVVRDVYVHGFNYAAEHYGLPIRFDARYGSGYFYQTFTPTEDAGDLSESVVRLINRIDGVGSSRIDYTQNAPEAMSAEHYPKLQEAVSRLKDYWGTELLPEIEKLLSDWEDFDLLRADTPQLLDHLEETHKGIKRLGEIRFLADFALFLALYQFEDLYRELFGDEAGDEAVREAQRLLQGSDGKTREINQMLWELSREALSKPKVRKVLEESAAADVVSRLGQTTEGKEFLVALRSVLKEYGQQVDGYATIGLANWTENPTSVIKGLKDYLYHHDPVAASVGLAAEREWRVSKAREQLEHDTDHFESVLERAQKATVVREDREFWIDSRAMYQVRRVLQETGRRFAKSRVLERQDDILYLTFAELREMAEALPERDGCQLVAERKAKLERFRDIQPRPTIDRMPLEGSSDSGGPAIEKSFHEMDELQRDPKVLYGIAWSPGNVRGRAKVVRSLAEASKLREGDVLVAEAPTLRWTTLFATVSAVVTDAGNELSYCMAAAHEYCIPAVVGTGAATATIRDGQSLEVDGNTGLVRIVNVPNYLARKISWRKNADHLYPYVAYVDGEKCVIRLNDFPAEHLYTLITDDVEMADFSDWPEQWTRP